jgi:photosystem II stability/assembly factor-like uncharacterized protein
VIRSAALLLALATALPAQQRGARTQRPTPARPVARTVTPAPVVTQAFDSVALAGLRYRELGPYRGGRSVAVAGSLARPNEYYMGTTGGGVFKTTDGGHAWFPVTDRYFGGTIGAIRVAPSNPDIVYVGGGEFPIRGNVSHGDGLWKSTDGGRTWALKGLADARQIADILVHPTNPDLVYAGVLGHVFGPSGTRGVYRSRDGGNTWQRILFRNDSTGIVDLVMDPNNPNVLYAGFWQARRTPWMLVSGGTGSGMMKSTDGGDTWTEITRNPGLPSGIWGDLGISVSGANSNRVYAIIEAGEGQGGVYVSDDAGGSWRKTNGESSLTQRAWYYMKIHADPKNQDVVYVNNVSFLKSTDGGRTFRPLPNPPPHSDSHDLWIAPDNSSRMIQADDGGASVTTDGGRTWTPQDFATAQFYHVITTNHFPYRICGAQQDNSTLCGPSRKAGGIAMSDWQETAGGESGYIAVRHDDPDIVYGGSYGGLLTRMDMRTGLERNVNAWPDNPMGHPARDLKYRFQWTFPIIVSPHNSDVVYITSQHVHKSTNGGERWTVVSPDLSYNDKSTQGNSGGPITLDQTSVEYYGVVFALAESPVRAGLLWAGTDDGRVWVTRNGGASWTEVTPKDMVKFTRVSSVDPSAHAECAAYVAGNRFQLQDDKPYLWKTTDCGATWTRIDDGIAAHEFTRVLREDPERRGLLFAGTERGVWMSPNDGRTWQPLRLNLPYVPVHDLQIKEGDLVLGTHGRSFYVLDNISALRQLSDAIVASDAHLFAPRPTYRASFGGGFGGGGGGGGGGGAQPATAPVNPVATNPPNGAIIQYWLTSANQEVTLSILDSAGNLIRSFTSRQDSMQAADSLARETRRRTYEDSLRNAGLPPDSVQRLGRAMPNPPQEFAPGWRPTSPPRAANRRGINAFGWDMRYPAPSAFRGMILWAANANNGPMAPPGTYIARLAVNGRTVGQQNFRLLPDPRVTGVTPAEYAEQFRFLRRVANRFSEANDAVSTIRVVKTEVDDRRGKLPSEARATFDQHANALTGTLTSVEDSIYQTKSRSGQDPLNYPIRLNNKLGALLGVAGSSDGRPTAQTYEVFTLLSGQLEGELRRMRVALTTHLPAINAILRDYRLPEIVPRSSTAPALVP